MFRRVLLSVGSFSFVLFGVGSAFADETKPADPALGQLVTAWHAAQLGRDRQQRLANRLVSPLAA